MNFLTQINLGEIKAFLDALDENELLIPSWARVVPSEEDHAKVSLARVPRGTVRTLKITIDYALTSEFHGNRYHPETLVDVRSFSEEPLTFGMLVASIRSWKRLGE